MSFIQGGIKTHCLHGLFRFGIDAPPRCHDSSFPPPCPQRTTQGNGEPYDARTGKAASPVASAFQGSYVISVEFREVVLRYLGKSPLGTGLDFCWRSSP